MNVHDKFRKDLGKGKAGGLPAARLPSESGFFARNGISSGFDVDRASPADGTVFSTWGACPLLLNSDLNLRFRRLDYQVFLYSPAGPK
jgi:hypothetical protein